uniref:Integrase catalytic domain-containing protein n=1 Tax=Lutzomyia longipalpis TaxID=7200 RepID=A0A1B0CRK0_LUTLO
MAPLPPERVNDCVFPFVKCGMDFFGPLEVKVGRRIEKRWGVIFTCMATRAVHLEIVHSMTTNSAIMAIRRMENIWGPITDIFCDNGTNLRGADNEFRRLFESLDKDEIQDYLSEKRVQFHFSPPATPHMGGVWERLIRSVKTVLKEVMKSQHPSDEELRTYFTEVQCILNNRPLTYVATEPEDDTALTPNLILLRRSGDNRPIGEFDDGDLISRKTWRKVQRMADQFWQRWMREYLPELARRTKWYHPVKPIAVGDVVVICDGQLPRNKWPMGRVVEVFVGKDGKIRSAAVQTKEGVYDRPVVKLAALDVSSAASSDSN